MGAIAGDELLITFARRLFSVLRTSDVLARTGGDEFGILIRASTMATTTPMLVAERIEDTCSLHPSACPNSEIRVECAIGCALLSKTCEVAEEAAAQRPVRAEARQADAARSSSTRLTKRGAARRRFSIETELRRAIEGDQLTLAFQPLIDLQTGMVSGFEALARWDHEERGSISPTEFIPVAEELGLIVALGAGR